MFDSCESNDMILDGGSLQYCNPQDVKQPSIGDKVNCSFLIDYEIGATLCKQLDATYEIPPMATFTLYQTTSCVKLIVLNADNLISRIFELEKDEYNYKAVKQFVDDSSTINKWLYHIPTIIVSILTILTILIIIFIKEGI